MSYLPVPPSSTHPHYGIAKVGTAKILVVDDIADNSLLLQTLLEMEGYQVDVADDGFIAIAKIEANPPSLLLLDLMMPGMNGYEVAQRIQQDQLLSAIPILLVTGYDHCPPPQNAQIKVNGIIRKPIIFDELLSQVRAALQPNEAHCSV